VTRRIAAVAAIGIAAAVAGGAVPANAAGPTYISVLGPYNATDTKVLDIANWSMDNRGPAHLWTLRTTGNVDNQRWYVFDSGTLNGHRVVELVNVNSNKCLDKSEDVPNANGNAVYQYRCTGLNNQLWEFIPGPDAFSHWGELKNVAGGRCLDIQGPSFTDGARIHVWDCYGAWNQRWNID